MLSTICRDNHENSEVINMEVEGLGYIPICKQDAEQLIKNKKMICKRKIINKNQIAVKICDSTADYLLNTKLGYEAICDDCIEQNDNAVTTLLITHKYGEVPICNKYRNYIGGFKAHQDDFMGLIDIVPLDDYFIDCHENPESYHYYQDYRNYHIMENEPEYDWACYDYDADDDCDCGCDNIFNN